MAEAKYMAQLETLGEELMGKIPANEIQTTEDALEFLSTHAAALDDSLAQFVLLSHGTPARLAEYESLVDELLQNTTLLKAMLLADGPKEGDFGNAMKIYKEIQLQRTNHETKHKVLDQLALAIALEHAQPILENNSGKWGAQKEDHYVDPVARYLNYRQAYLDGELDDTFHTLDAWNLRFLVDGDEPDAIAAWGRTMLRNFRPDNILKDEVWRYVSLVRTDIPYGNDRLSNDREDLNFYQNILMNGGICGRRAWFGRFILRAFGIPTTARPSRGHGALIRWTTNGWVALLGPPIGNGWTKTMYRADIDFADSAAARCGNPEDFMDVLRARWIGDLMGEIKIYGQKDAQDPKKVHKIGLWYGASIEAQKAILVSQTKEATEECPASPIVSITQRLLSKRVPKQDIEYGDDGSIKIPAVAYSNKRVQGVIRTRDFGTGGEQLVLPGFKPQGKTVIRGGTFKNDADTCCSGSRMFADGKGKYENFGFRIALSGPKNPNSNPPAEKTIDLPEGVKLEMVYIKPGVFTMGGSRDHDKRFFGIEVPHHEVEITRGFYIGKYPVTQEQFEAVTGRNPSKSTRDPKCPVDMIGDQEVADFCESFAEAAGGQIRTPTEAEWEYAARAGTSTKYHFGDDESELGDYAWFSENAGGMTHPVGEKKPNQWGLYDIYGNVVERVLDKYEKNYYAKSPRVDPQGPSPGISSELEYTFKAPKAGRYSLTAQVCTMNEKQSMMIESQSVETEMVLPFTLASWGEQTIQVELAEGENTLRFWRDKPPQYGIALRSIMLKPL